MTTLTEQQLEDTLINQLVLNDYERAIIPNIDALQENFRKQMNRLNKENLKGTELSDKEFVRILLIIEGKSVFESAKILRDKHVLRRDDESEIYIQLFDRQSWHKNHFQVTNQTTVIGTYTNRYDVTILMNGLPDNLRSIPNE